VCHYSEEKSACALWNEIIAFCPIGPVGPCGDKELFIIKRIMS